MTTNPYPVDSATRTCCGGIGTHTRDCSEPRLSDLPSTVHAMTNTITSESSAQTWRDLKDQLTDNQIGWALTFEKDALGDPAEVAEHLLEAVREHARQNKIDDEQFGHIPAPADARKLWHWDKDNDGQWRRYFEGTSHDVVVAASSAGGRPQATISIAIDGFQYGNGTFERDLNIYMDGGITLTSALARMVSDALSASADELDQLGG